MAVSSDDTARRPGLPRPSTVLSEEHLVSASTRRVRPGEALAAPPTVYRILVTNQMDAYDDPLVEVETAALHRAAPSVLNDEFKGTARKAAKLSVADAEMELFDDLKDLIESLPSKRTMTRIRPRITSDANSGRVKKENRNVRVDAFLYAASREKDNDYHLIIGRAADAEPFLCMNVEVSGLPPADSTFFESLSRGRTAYKTFFGNNLPGTSYSFYVPPIPVVVEGSLFFDMTHATGSQPGPQDLRPFIPTVWEIHPITNLVFEP